MTAAGSSFRTTARAARPGEAMAVQVKLFAALRERAGWSERLVEPSVRPATPLSLWQELGLSVACGAVLHAPVPGVAAAEGRAAGPAGGDPAATDTLPPGIRVAINQSFAAVDTPLADGDELAFLPPISGG